MVGIADHGVTILALVSEIGIDPLGSHDITEGPMRDD